MKRLPCLISIIVSLILLISCSPKSEVAGPEENEKSVPVRVMEIKSRDFPLTVQSIGRLAPNREVTLSAEVGGVIESYNANTGDRVGSGQTLVEIDPTDYRLALMEAEANLLVAQARLYASEKSFERSSKLLPGNILTPEAFDKSEAEFKSASASVTRVQVLVDIAKERLAKAKIITPFGGLIASRMVEKGQIVGAGEPLMTLMDLDSVRVKVSLSEMDYAKLDRDDPVSLFIEACPGMGFSGHIDRIGIKADEKTNTFEVEILVKNPDLSLKAGMTARVTLTTAIVRDAILIPQSAVLYRKDRKEVFIVGPDQRAEARKIELGRSEGSLVQIVKGLISGDRLVVAGGQYLKQGDKVEISSTDQTGAL